MGGLGTVLYRSVAKRFSTLFLAAAGGAFFFEAVIVKGNDYFWEKVSFFTGVYVSACKLMSFNCYFIPVFITFWF